MQTPSAEQLNKQMDPGRWPAFKLVEANATSISLDITVGDQLGYFQGHFPGQPILPGVVQVHWAAELGRLIFGCRGFSSLRKVKFNSVIVPATNARLSLDYQPESGNLNFSYSDDKQRYSSGIISFQSTP